MTAHRSLAGALRHAGRWCQRTGEVLRPPRLTVDAPTYRRPAPPPSAFASHGGGSWLVPPCRVTGAERIELGAGVVVLEHAEVRVAPGASLRIGDRVRFGRFLVVDCHVWVDIADDVGGSDCVGITDGGGALPPEPVVVEAGAYLGANSIVTAGVRVGEGAYVGEGAVVLDDVAPGAVVYGNPARVVRGPAGSTG